MPWGFTAEDDEPEIGVRWCVKSVARWKTKRNRLWMVKKKKGWNASNKSGFGFDSLIRRPSGLRHEIYLDFSREPSRFLFLVAGWSTSGSIGCPAIKTKVTGSMATTAKPALHHRRPCVFRNHKHWLIVNHSAAHISGWRHKGSLTRFFFFSVQHLSCKTLTCDISLWAETSNIGRACGQIYIRRPDVLSHQLFRIGGPSSFTKPLSRIICFPSLRYLPFKVKPPTRTECGPRNPSLIPAGYGFASAAPPREWRNTCVRLMRTRRLGPSSCLPPPSGRVERHEKRLWRGLGGRGGGY